VAKYNGPNFMSVWFMLRRRRRRTPQAAPVDRDRSLLPEVRAERRRLGGALRPGLRHVSAGCAEEGESMKVSELALMRNLQGKSELPPKRNLL
jgi:hypothetical protein